MVVPMRAGGATIGALTFVNADSGRAFDADDLAFAEDLAARAADRGRERAPVHAAGPDRGDAPAQPAARPAGAAAGLAHRGVLPARASAAPRSAATSTTSSAVDGRLDGRAGRRDRQGRQGRRADRARAAHRPRPARASTRGRRRSCGRVNDVLREQPELSIVTVVCARLRESGAGAEVALVSAGHPLPLRVAPGGEVDAGRALRRRARRGRRRRVGGVGDDLAPGDTLLFYTDGVTDLPGDDGPLRRAAAASRRRPRARTAPPT